MRQTVSSRSAMGKVSAMGWANAGQKPRVYGTGKGRGFSAGSTSHTSARGRMPTNAYATIWRRCNRARAYALALAWTVSTFEYPNRFLGMVCARYYTRRHFRHVSTSTPSQEGLEVLTCRNRFA